MPTPDQLKLLFGEFPIPLAIAALAFGLAWLAARPSTRFFNASSRTGHLDIWALALALTVGQHGIDGLSGFPPTDALDWLPIGLLAIALAATAGAFFRLPAPATTGIVSALSVAILALTLHGFKSYRDAYPLGDRLLVLAAIVLVMFASGAGLCALAQRLTLADFFVLTGVVGTVGVGVLFNGFNTTKVAQVLGLALAVGGAGFVVGLATKTRHVSPAFAAGWTLLWTVLVSNAYFGNYELPPTSALALLLAVPAFAGIGLLVCDPRLRPVGARFAVYVAALAAALLAFGLSKPLGESDDEKGPYADWGG